ncbi:Oidioi.mRNA.OKI2018_I69.chr1.g788.t1.cds [Oikopleura dioica]|uniref:Oidioi.mRNA.OKI2018_I69.chr1.g788.t1.cds n=1 Tax=Oikopleura dioica TaxID=34765 RepID=A0ABN7SKY3_OIKDI|nr:Oidioi.mRNA.OKI2018_I69.chr1.g788.t1.cds [Oikopleura dioica]
MKLASFFALATNHFANAYYYSKDFVNFANFIPGPNVRIGEEMTYRSIERMWLNELRDVNPDICDLNISLLGESSADISADYSYYFIIQVMYKGSPPSSFSSDVSAVFPSGSLPGSSEYQNAWDANPDLELAPNGIIHEETCFDDATECRNIFIDVDFCYDIPMEFFDISDADALDAAKTAVMTNFQAGFGNFTDHSSFFQNYYINSEFNIVSVNDVSEETGDLYLGSSFNKAGTEKGVHVKGTTKFTKTTFSSEFEFCFSMSGRFEELPLTETLSKFEWMTGSKEYFTSLNNYKLNSESFEYSYQCVAPDCEASTSTTTTTTTTTTTKIAGDCHDGNNGGCSHMCASGFCYCPPCWELLPNQLTCRPSPGLAQLTCSQEGMKLVVDKCVIPGVSEIALLDDTCEPTEEDGSYVFETALDECGSSHFFDGEYIRFENTIVAGAGFDNGIMIARPSHLDFHCDFDTAGEINDLWLNTTNYAVEVTFNIGEEAPEKPAFIYDVNFYTDGSFTQIQDTNDQSFSIGDTIYAAVSTNVDVDGMIFSVDQCTLYDQSTGDSFEIIENRCGSPLVNTVISSYSDDKIIRFQFLSFVFPNSDDSAKLSIACSVMVCDENDSDSTCLQDPGCGARRKRRSEPQEALSFTTNFLDFTMEK